MTRKQQLINQLEAAINKAEQWLIDTPVDATDQEYQVWLDKLKAYQDMLALVKEI